MKVVVGKTFIELHLNIYKAFNNLSIKRNYDFDPKENHTPKSSRRENSSPIAKAVSHQPFQSHEGSPVPITDQESSNTVANRNPKPIRKFGPKGKTRA